MAEVAKVAGLRLLTYQPPSSSQTPALVAGEDITAGDACYVKSDGLAWLSTGAAANAAAKVRGFALVDTLSGGTLALFADVLLEYGSSLTPGANYYLSGTVPGGLSTVATTGGTAPIGYAMDTTSIFVTRSTY